RFSRDWSSDVCSSDLIVFAGVHFMAETAKILNPTKKVVLPDLNAGCSLADSCPAPGLAAFKAQHPGAVVVSYINCTAEVKALSRSEERRVGKECGTDG